MGRMSGMDAAFLTMERPNEPRHIGGVSIFGPGRDGPLTFEAVRSLVAERLPLVPSARRIVVEMPLGLGRPSWAPDPQFDLEFHVRQAAVPVGGGDAALARFVADTQARPLDRRRPLWELWVVEGLSGGRVAIYTKVHVAAIDAITGAEMMTALLDTDPAGRPVEALTGANGEEPPLDVVERVLGPLPDQIRHGRGLPMRLVNRARRTIGEQLPGARETIGETARRTPGLETVTRLLLGPPEEHDDDVFDEHPTGRAPHVSWNEPITAHRRFAFTSLALDDIIRVKRAAETTVNDVVVAVCAGAVRRWLIDHEELPSSPLVAMVPLLVAGPGTGHDRAHIAGLFAPLPTNVADPLERLARTHEALRTAKERHAAIPASLMQDMSMYAPPAIAGLAGRLIEALPHRSFVSPTVNLAITNVPGPARGDVPRRASVGGQLPGDVDQRPHPAAPRPAIGTGRHRARRGGLPGHHGGPRCARRRGGDGVDGAPGRGRRSGRPAGHATGRPPVDPSPMS